MLKRTLIIIIILLIILFAGCISQEELMGNDPGAKTLKIELIGVGDGEVEGTIKSAESYARDITLKTPPGYVELKIGTDKLYDIQFTGKDFKGMQFKVYLDGKELVQGQDITVSISDNAYEANIGFSISESGETKPILVTGH